MKNILFLNHKQKQCGVYQYGYRSVKILQESKVYNFIYCEVDNEREYLGLIELCNPHGIIYNYHPSTMSWVDNKLINRFHNIFHFGIHHEGTETMRVWFDYYIITDSTFKDIHNKHSVPRPLFENVKEKFNIARCLSIGSFGFGFKNKGFERLVQMVNNQYDTCKINLHIPFAYYGDADGAIAREVVRNCYSKVTKPGIELNITHDFLTDDEILSFLAANDLNAFLYDEMPGRGLSSVIDYALSVKKPIAITDTTMFRHISATDPCICVERATLEQIRGNGVKGLQQYNELWSNENFIKKYEQIIGRTEKLV